MILSICFFISNFSFAIDLDLSGLSSLSKMSKDLNQVVKMQKELDKLPIVLMDNNRSKIEDNNTSK